MKNLEQIQEENRKSIILANNPEDYDEAKDYEEALEMELDIGCIIARHDTEETQKAVAKLLGFGEGEND
jgi:hypothetical protein